MCGLNEDMNFLPEQNGEHVEPRVGGVQRHLSLINNLDDNDYCLILNKK